VGSLREGKVERARSKGLLPTAPEKPRDAIFVNTSQIETAPPPQGKLDSTNMPSPMSSLLMPWDERFVNASQIERSPSPQGSKLDSTIMSCFTKQGQPAQTQSKLVFVHVFKTAGSTIRSFFRAYAERCRRGWTCAIGCSLVDPMTLGPTSGKQTWALLRHTISGIDTNHKKPEGYCRMKDYITRAGLKREFLGPFESRSEVANEHIYHDTDILGGHMPLGIGEKSWPGVQEVRYLTFVRSAVSKYVSARIYSAPDLSTKKYVRLIRKTLNKEQEVQGEKRYHQGYSKYLITPEQHKRGIDVSKNSLNAVESARMRSIICDNLYRMNVTVGVVERWSESMELLQDLIDPTRQATDLFIEYGMTQEARLTNFSNRGASGHGAASKRPQTTVRKNVSGSGKTSTPSVVEVLKKDAKVWSMLQEYLKFDQEIYECGLKIHKSQYKIHVSQYGSRAWPQTG